MGVEVAYRDNRGSWSLKIFWSTFVRSRTEFTAFQLLLLLNMASTLSQAVLSWRKMGSEMTRGLLWFAMLLTGVFLLGLVVALVRSSLSDARDVEGVEARAPLETVAAMIVNGRLNEHTLVDVGRGWQTARDCYEFEDAVLAAQKKQRARRVVNVLGALSLIGAVMAYLLR